MQLAEYSGNIKINLNLFTHFVPRASLTSAEDVREVGFVEGCSNWRLFAIFLKLGSRRESYGLIRT